MDVTDVPFVNWIPRAAAEGADPLRQRTLQHLRSAHL